jgi:hypothetical protein
MAGVGMRPMTAKGLKVKILRPFSIEFEILNKSTSNLCNCHLPFSHLRQFCARSCSKDKVFIWDAGVAGGLFWASSIRIFLENSFIFSSKITRLCITD